MLFHYPSNSKAVMGKQDFFSFLPVLSPRLLLEVSADSRAEDVCVGAHELDLLADHEQGQWS